MEKQRLEVVETNRLVGERIAPRHLPLLQALHQDPRVSATLGGYKSDQQVAASLERQMAHWRSFGFGLWLFSERSTGAPVGRGGLMFTDTGGPDGVEVGYAIYAKWWRNGLATEIAQLSVRVGFDQVGLDELVCYTLVDNVASRGVMERAGFVYDRPVTHAGLPHALYRQSRPAHSRPPE